MCLCDRMGSKLCANKQQLATHNIRNSKNHKVFGVVPTLINTENILSINGQ
jgi:hypothetical protein